MCTFCGLFLFSMNPVERFLQFYTACAVLQLSLKGLSKAMNLYALIMLFIAIMNTGYGQLSVFELAVILIVYTIAVCEAFAVVLEMIQLPSPGYTSSIST